MFINSVLSTIRPIYESSKVPAKYKNAVDTLGDYLDGVYNKNKRWETFGISPTAAEVAELYDVYKHLVHDGVNLSDIETISQTVHDMLAAFGFNLKEKGVGWVLSEEAAPKKTFKLTYKVSGIYDVYSRTEETAEMDIQDASFGDLIDVTWEQDSVEFTMDGRREDLVHVTYVVSGTTEPIFVKSENEQLAKKQAEQILSTEDFGPIEDIEFECISCETKMNESWEMPPEYVESLKRTIAKYNLPKWFETIVIDGGHDEVLDGKILDVYSGPDFVEITMDRYGDPVMWRVYKNGTVVER